MVIISKATINEYAQKQPTAKAALTKWYIETKNADWKDFNDMKSTFNTVDAVANDRYIFDIKGNQFRLVALIIFKVRTVFILFIGTHSDYDKIDAAHIHFKK